MVTVIGPVCAPFGTSTFSSSAVANFDVSVSSPAKFTVFSDSVGLKFVPVILIVWPIPATGGPKDLIVGTG